MSLPPDSVTPPPGDIAPVTAAALHLARFASEPTMRRRLSSSPPPQFDLDRIDGLEDAALAAKYADEQLAEAARHAQIPSELVGPATDLKERMLDVLEEHFADDAVISTEVVLIRAATSTGSLASNLSRLALLFETHERTIARATYYRATYASDARTMAEWLRHALRASETDEARKWGDIRARAWTVLLDAYEEVRTGRAPSRLPA